MRAQLAAFLEHLRLNRNASAHTAAAYESDIAQFLDFTAQQLAISALEPEHLQLGAIRAFMAELYRQGHARTSVARKLSALRAFGRYLRREGLIETDPALLAASPKRERKIPAHLSIDEMTRLLEMPDVSDPLGCRDRAILEVFYASGLRLSELVGLDLDDVNLRARMVRVMGKGAKERLVPFNTATESSVREWLKARAVLRASPNAERRSESREPRAQSPEPQGPEPRAVVPELPWRPFDRPQRPASRGAICGVVQHAVRYQPARAASLLCHSSAGTGRGSARDPGVAWARPAVHDTALHARQRRAAARCLPQGASASKADMTRTVASSARQRGQHAVLN